jgi:hypothetical protein
MLIVVLADGTTYGPLEGCRVVSVPDGLSGEDLDTAVAAMYEKADDLNVVDDEGLFIIHRIVEE